jgi:hypothetical protein
MVQIFDQKLELHTKDRNCDRNRSVSKIKMRPQLKWKHKDFLGEFHNQTPFQHSHLIFKKLQE